MNPKTRNSAILLGTGAIGGALITTLIFLGVWYAPNKSRDESLTLVAINSSTSEPEQRYISSSLSTKSGLSFEMDSSGSVDGTLNIESDFDQTVALYNVLAGADEERVLGLIDHAMSMESSHQRDSALAIIFSKYADFNPVKALQKAQEFGSSTREKLISSVFSQWAKSDLDAALESAKSMGDEYLEFASRSILNTRDDLNLDRLYALADELQNVEYRNKYTARIWRARALKDPRSAWQSALLSIGDDQNNPLMLTTIAEAWIEKEGLTALDEINASTVGEYFKMRIYQKVLGQIAETDVERAVNVAANLRLNATGYSPTSRVVSEIFTKWAEQDPYRLFGLAESLDPRFVSIAKHQALAAITRESPQEAVMMLSQEDNPAFVMHASATIARVWAETDPKSSLDWYVSGNRSEHDPVLGYVMRELVAEGAHDAFKVVSNYSGELGTLLTNSFFRAAVLQGDVDATQFISLLDDHKRQEPVTFVGRVLARTDITQALELEKTLPESGREDFRTKIISAASFPDPFYLFENIDKLPGSELQSQAAVQLLMRDKAEGVFSEEQLKNLRSRLDADGKRKVDSVVVTGRYYR